MIVRGLTLPGAVKGLEYLFKPNWSGFTSSAIFNAMGFTFFSLSLGAAVMVTYAGYLSEKVNLLTSTAWVVFLAIMAAVLGGLMVMPAVFAFNLSPTAGPGLTFVTMPAIFSQMPFGVFLRFCSTSAWLLRRLRVQCPCLKLWWLLFWTTRASLVRP